MADSDSLKRVFPSDGQSGSKSLSQAMKTIALHPSPSSLRHNVSHLCCPSLPSLLITPLSSSLALRQPLLSVIRLYGLYLPGVLRQQQEEEELVMLKADWFPREAHPDKLSLNGCFAVRCLTANEARDCFYVRLRQRLES